MTLVCGAALLVAACGTYGSDGSNSARVEAKPSGCTSERCKGEPLSESDRAQAENERRIGELQRQLAGTRDEDKKVDLQTQINALRGHNRRPKTPEPCIPNGDPLSPCG